MSTGWASIWPKTLIIFQEDKIVSGHFKVHLTGVHTPGTWQRHPGTSTNQACFSDTWSESVKQISIFHHRTFCPYKGFPYSAYAQILPTSPGWWIPDMNCEEYYQITGRPDTRLFADDLMGLGSKQTRHHVHTHTLTHSLTCAHTHTHRHTHKRCKRTESCGRFVNGLNHHWNLPAKSDSNQVFVLAEYSQNPLSLPEKCKWLQNSLTPPSSLTDVQCKH